MAPLRLAGDPGPSLEDRIIQSLPPVQATRWASKMSRKGKAVLAAAAAVLLAAVGAGVNLSIERNGLAFPSALPFTMAKAPESDRQLGLGVHALKRSEDTSTKALEMPHAVTMSSADDLAKGIRDQTLAPLAQVQSKVGAETARATTERGADVWATTAMPPANLPVPPAASEPRSGAVPARPSGGLGGGAGGGMNAYRGGGVAGGRPGEPVVGDDKDSKRERGNLLVWNYTNNGALPSLGATYFKPGDDWARQDSFNDKRKDLNELSERDLQKLDQLASIAGKQLSKEQNAPTKTAEDIKKTEPAPAPLPEPRRIIIRTGDLEFEIESFDASVATILKLVSAAKGSFVATINSDKLPNGKVRGAVVVRVPPELLDNFVLDLRKELAKTGELKNQRIGSQDITKQYTDLESRLRAARAMEERLLKIIKDGKGQIKDLLAAEKELGVWRTQIESLEGELRYYGNQAAYSTLTIKLYEKNIRSAASITESERVQAGLEVEDVEKAHREALKAIYDAKGRVTRSELKQHGAGQFNAILNFEVGPDAAGPMRDRLKQLGTMVRLQVDRVQQTEGGGPAPKDGKIERGPTLFFVSIYNLANVAPRETVILRLAAADVSTVFNKLRGVIAVAKGQVINAQLDEKDRKNVTAQLDFHVSRLGEGEVLTALLGAGETLTRQVNRVPENDNVTDAKVLYRITLVDADSIQPRETVVMRIAAADVPAAYQKLREALAKAKARIFTAQLNEQDRRNVTAQLDFSIRRGEEAMLQVALKVAGETLSRQATRLPENPNLTDAKVLIQVTLFDVDAVQPRETVNVKIAATDVAAAYESLRTAVAAAKGRIVTAQINEQNRRNITAQLDVTVNRGDAKALETALAAAGETLSRQVTRAAETGNVTDAKLHAVIELMPAAAIAPRETVTLAMEVTDVAATLTLFSAQVKEAQGRTVETQVGQERNGQISAHVIFDVPWSAAAALAEKFKTAGQVRVHQVTRDPQAPEGNLAIGRLVITLSNTPLLVPSDQGLWSQLRSGLAISLRGLSISASWLIVGLLFVLPWVLVVYAVLWLARRFARRTCPRGRHCCSGK